MKMKKGLTLVLALLVLFTLSACGGSSEPEATPAPTPEQTPAPTPAPTEEPKAEESDRDADDNALAEAHKVEAEMPENVERVTAEAEPREEAIQTNSYSMNISLGGSQGTATLELLDDTNALFTAFMNFDCTYEKIGSAVVLTPVEEPTETKAQIWAAVKHAYLLNDADMSLTALEGAYKAGKLVFYLLDETNMKAEHPAYGFGKEGFTYIIEDGVLKVTPPDATVLGAFAKVWDAMGAAEWTIDGNSVTPITK